MSATKTKPRTIDEYLAGVNADQRAALEKLRKTIRTVAPKAEECTRFSRGSALSRPLVHGSLIHDVYPKHKPAYYAL